MDYKLTFALLLFVFNTSGASANQKFEFNWSNTVEIDDSEYLTSVLAHKVALLTLGLETLSDKLNLGCEVKSSQVNVPKAIEGFLWGFEKQKWSVDVHVNCLNPDVTYLKFFQGHLQTDSFDDCRSEPARVLVKYKTNPTQFWVSESNPVRLLTKHEINSDSDTVVQDPAIDPNAWTVHQIEEADKTEADYGEGFGRYNYICW